MGQVTGRIPLERPATIKGTPGERMLLARSEVAMVQLAEETHLAHYAAGNHSPGNTQASEDYEPPRTE